MRVYNIFVYIITTLSSLVETEVCFCYPQSRAETVCMLLTLSKHSRSLSCVNAVLVL